jgi:hypothetical protein
MQLPSALNLERWRVCNVRVFKTSQQKTTFHYIDLQINCDVYINVGPYISKFCFFDCFFFNILF